MRARRILVGVGEVYGQLTVLGEAPRRGPHRRVRVQCACGVEQTIGLSQLRSGRTRSCGHWVPAPNASPLVRPRRTVDWPEYDVWQNMLRRCYTPTHHKYALYGGRGIRVDAAWVLFFDAFVEDMGVRPSPAHVLDRLDNDQGYNKENCVGRRCGNRTSTGGPTAASSPS